MLIDTSFDVRADANGRDPDFASRTLRAYHQFLWSKALPSGALFTLADSTKGSYLHHQSRLGEFWLSSDSVVATFTRWPAMAPIIRQLPEGANEEFRRIGYTLGGFILWPGNRVDGKWTINQARGCIRGISDRMDLTVECIRRHYLGGESPLGATLARYGDFFALFQDFRGYVDFWLLQDLVTNDYAKVRFLAPFDDFKPPHVPSDLPAYLDYRRRSIEVVERRNERINRFAARVDARQEQNAVRHD